MFCGDDAENGYKGCKFKVTTAPKCMFVLNEVANELSCAPTRTSLSADTSTIDDGNVVPIWEHTERDQCRHHRDELFFHMIILPFKPASSLSGSVKFLWHIFVSEEWNGKFGTIFTIFLHSVEQFVLWFFNIVLLWPKFGSSRSVLFERSQSKMNIWVGSLYSDASEDYNGLTIVFNSTISSIVGFIM